MLKAVLQRGKKNGMTCNGKRPVQVKTLHGEFSFELQRYLEGKKSSNYFELTKQMKEDYTAIPNSNP